tara:strand:+ start:1243 stop:1566 length:324 start_codon:yes stop_codon:yes gene_type:complete
MNFTHESPLAFIGNFGGGEMILIFLIVLLLFGAKKVPELFRSLGKGMNEFRKAKNEWDSDISEVMNQDPIEDHDFKAAQAQAKTEEHEEDPHHEDVVHHEGEKQTAS